METVPRLWGTAIHGDLAGIWINKIKHIIPWPSVERVEVRAFGSTTVVERDAISKNAHSHENWRVHRTKRAWVNILRQAYLHAEGILYTKVEQVGWEKTKEWLSTRMPDEVTGGFSVWWNRMGLARCGGAGFDVEGP